MPRPRKFRRICQKPTIEAFGPVVAYDDNIDEYDYIIMSFEEYETIRLMDYEGLTQEECGVSMNIGRSSVQRIYIDARRKIAKGMVEGKPIRIEGGDYKLCEDEELEQRCPNCKRLKKESNCKGNQKGRGRRRF
ncbi:MAG: DUF134 domain-containing protein [Peptostreptococcaceae bacterium]|jgi:predicted DNA-binding protein (UPF0251 family)|nr:DUF134 domain-containing protein [Peptostreptococcaceae bacterium]